MGSTTYFGNKINQWQNMVHPLFQTGAQVKKLTILTFMKGTRKKVRFEVQGEGRLGSHQRARDS